MDSTNNNSTNVFVSNAREAFASVRAEFEATRDKHAALQTPEDNALAKTADTHAQYIARMEKCSDEALATMETFAINPTHVARQSREFLKRFTSMMTALSVNATLASVKDNAADAALHYIKAKHSQKTFSNREIQAQMNHVTDTQAIYFMNMLKLLGCVTEQKTDKDAKRRTWTLDRKHPFIVALVALYK